MERHDNETSAGMENALGRVQCPHKLAEFIVDGDPQPLKHARRRMDSAGLLPDQRGHQIGQLLCRLERLPAPRLDDRARNRTGAPLLTVMVENVSQFGFGRIR